MKALTITSLLLSGVAMAAAAPTSYFNATGIQNMGSTGDWGTNAERDSDTAFELTFDFTTAGVSMALACLIKII